MRIMLRLVAVALVLALSLSAARADPDRAVLYKAPDCDCCEGYAAHLHSNGFTVEVRQTHDLAEISREAGVRPEFQGCHTTLIDGYVVDGHVPASVIRRMLTQRPPIAGITL